MSELPVDGLLSFAARSGDSVRLQVTVPPGGLEPGPLTLRLRAGRRSVDSPAELRPGGDAGEALVLTSTVRLPTIRRAWRLILLPASQEEGVPLQARLLAPDDQPVALLPGPVPATRMRPPAPRPESSPVHRLARRLPEPVKRPLRRGRARLLERRSPRRPA